MSREEFADRYMITTVRGEIYSYPKMRAAALKQIRKSPLPLRGSTLRHVFGPADVSIVDGLLQNDSFMRRFVGMIPARVAEAVEEVVWEALRQ